ncbi:unnamed protein product [Amoebophrya sp. A25]|nr:unnamed protein product [Amoebophrya sp. A25]|eukprot:GSA25T00020894001.1
MSGGSNDAAVGAWLSQLEAELMFQKLASIWIEFLLFFCLQVVARVQDSMSGVADSATFGHALRKLTNLDFSGGQAAEVLQWISENSQDIDLGLDLAAISHHLLHDEEGGRPGASSKVQQTGRGADRDQDDGGTTTSKSRSRSNEIWTAQEDTNKDFSLLQKSLLQRVGTGAPRERPSASATSRSRMPREQQQGRGSARTSRAQQQEARPSNLQGTISSVFRARGGTRGDEDNFLWNAYSASSDVEDLSSDEVDSDAANVDAVENDEIDFDAKTGSRSSGSSCKSRGRGVTTSRSRKTTEYQKSSASASTTSDKAASCSTRSTTSTSRRSSRSSSLMSRTGKLFKEFYRMIHLLSSKKPLLCAKASETMISRVSHALLDYVLDAREFVLKHEEEMAKQEGMNRERSDSSGPPPAAKLTAEDINRAQTQSVAFLVSIPHLALIRRSQSVAMVEDLVGSSSFYDLARDLLELRAHRTGLLPLSLDFDQEDGTQSNGSLKKRGTIFSRIWLRMGKVPSVQDLIASSKGGLTELKRKDV